MPYCAKQQKTHLGRLNAPGFLTTLVCLSLFQNRMPFTCSLSCMHLGLPHKQLKNVKKYTTQQEHTLSCQKAPEQSFLEDTFYKILIWELLFTTWAHPCLGDEEPSSGSDSGL